MKKIFLVSVVVMALASASYGVLIGNFEGGGDGFYSVDATMTNQADFGVTLDLEALQVTDANGGWGGRIQLPLLDQPNAAELVAAATAPGAVLTVDVTAFTADFPADDEWLEVALFMNADGYWNAIDSQAVTLDATTPMVFTFDAAMQEAVARGAGNASYANVGLLMNSSEAGSGQMYVDNIQIIPEPATLVLLGLGALTLLRRKR